MNRAVLTRRKVTPRVLPPFRHNRGNRHGSHNLPALALQLGLRKSHENRSRRRCSQRFHDLHPCYDLARDRAARGTTGHCRHHSFARSYYMYSTCTSSRPARSSSRPKLTYNSDVAGMASWRHPSGIPVVFVRHPCGTLVASWLASSAPTSGYSSIPSPLANRPSSASP